MTAMSVMSVMKMPFKMTSLAPALSLAVGVFVLGLAHPATAQCLQAALFPPNSAGAPSADSQFGFAVDVSGERLIVGAPGAASDPLAQSGYGLYERSGENWARVVDQFAQWGEADAGFDVALSGDWAAVGVPHIDTTPAHAGEVLVLHRLANGWRHVQTLTGEPGYGEEFGLSVDLDGGLLAVGLRSPSVGACHVFRLAGDAWVLDQLLVQAAPGDGFGRSVAVLDVDSSGTSGAPGASGAPLLIVGEPGHVVFGGGGGASGDDGAARVFRRDPVSGWSQIALLQSFLPHAQLGTAVALSGEFAVAGGPFADAGAFIDEGLSVVARWDGATYSGAIPIPGSAGELAGSSLAADDLHFYFGCPGWSGLFGETPQLGLLRGYTFDPSVPAYLLWPTATANGVTPVGQAEPGDDVGRSVAVDGACLVLGAPGHDGASADSGAIYVYDLSVPAWQWADFSIEGALGPSGGTAGLFASGSLCAGDDAALLLHHALPNVVAALVVGFSRGDAPFFGGVLIPTPDAIAYLPTDAAGDVHLSALLPRELPAGTDLWLQAWWPDAGGPQGFAASNAVHGVTH